MSKTKQWLQLTITCSTQLTDAVTDYLIGVFEAGVEVGVEDHLVEHTIHAYLEQENPTEEYIAGIADQVTGYLVELAEIFQVETPTLTTSLLEDEDWSSNWKKHFTPFAVSAGLIIKPTWEDYQPKDGEVVIEMDPGMAFGTGHHATTSLCLGFIRSVVKSRPGTVLDVGTGTGILAMAAALFGAPSVLAIDNDPEAVTAAFANVAHNNLQDRVTVEITSLDEVVGSFSLVVANIIHDALLTMVSALSRLTMVGGALVLSGILKGDQAENIIEAYEKAGFVVVERQVQGEWEALHLKKK